MSPPPSATRSTSPTPRPLSQAEVVEAFAKVCKKPVKFVRIPREYILRAGGHPMGPKLYFGNYFDMPPITQVTAKAQRVLKFKPTDFATGLKETYKWYLRHNAFPQARLRLRRSVAGHGTGAGPGEGLATVRSDGRGSSTGTAMREHADRRDPYRAARTSASRTFSPSGKDASISAVISRAESRS